MVGLKQTCIELNHSQRYSGKSSYSFLKSLTLAIHSLFAYSNTILKFISFVGFMVSFVSFCSAIYFMTKHYYIGHSVSGWASLIVSIFFSTGLIMLSIGTLGIYIGYIFQETKKRPLYLIEEIIESP